MIRVLDLVFSFLGLLFSSPLLLLIWLILRIESKSPLFFQERVGRYKKPFILVKFRTMRDGTDNLPTHLVDISAVTLLGSFLRKTKLDELPQLWNVLLGEMSLVGPRPCLFNQSDLISKRDVLGVFNARPGITGLSQTRCVDMSSPSLLAKTDAEMLNSLNVFHYFRYVILTFTGKGFGDNTKEKT